MFQFEFRGVKQFIEVSHPLALQSFSFKIKSIPIHRMGLCINNFSKHVPCYTLSKLYLCSA